MTKSNLISLVMLTRSFVQSKIGIPLSVSPELLRWYGAKIGERVFAEQLTTEEQFAQLLTIEDDVVLAYGCRIILHDSSLNNLEKISIKFGKVIIRQGAYIGANVTILPGVEIGSRALIGACSLVTHSIPAENIAYGVPAKTAGTISDLKQRYIENMLDTSNSNIFYMDIPPWRKRLGLIARLRQRHAYRSFIQNHL